MSLKKIVFKLIPIKTFVSLRKLYRSALKIIHKPLSEHDFRNILINNIGVHKGSVVFIHSSMDALNINFTVYRLLEILLETAGEDGTLVFPAWHFTYRAEEYLNKGLTFDVMRSPSVLGLLSELARRHPDAIRSIHPINSIVAIGRHAQEIVGQHGQSIYPSDEVSPLYKMMNFDGLIIGIGVDTNFLSFVHCPEDVLKEQFPIKTRLDQVFDAKVKLKDGSIKIIRTLAAHRQIKNMDITSFMNRYIKKSVCRNFRFRGNRFYVAHSRELFDSIIALSKENKTIYTNKAYIRNE
jgi:aminoglycoside 3-N-acetyltransferase